MASLAAHWSSVSPSLSLPPGKLHFPLAGSCPLCVRQNSTLGSCCPVGRMITTPTPTMGLSAYPLGSPSIVDLATHRLHPRRTALFSHSPSDALRAHLRHICRCFVALAFQLSVFLSFFSLSFRLVSSCYQPYPWSTRFPSRLTLVGFTTLRPRKSPHVSTSQGKPDHCECEATKMARNYTNHELDGIVDASDEGKNNGIEKLKATASDGIERVRCMTRIWRTCCDWCVTKEQGSKSTQGSRGTNGKPFGVQL